MENLYMSIGLWVHQSVRPSVTATLKDKKSDTFSNVIRNLRREKRMIKNERNQNGNQTNITKYKTIQERLRNQILIEKTEKTNSRLKKMTQDKTRIIFWKERKKLNRNFTNSCLTVKNDKGERIHDPEEIKQTTANYYENST